MTNEEWESDSLRAQPLCGVNSVYFDWAIEEHNKYPERLDKVLRNQREVNF